MRVLLLLILFFYAGVLPAQDFRFNVYRVEQGMPSDVIKAVAQDTLGFIWIATDDGLVKYDGLHFWPYRAAMSSQYTKGFLNTRDGRLLAIGDMDLIEITNRTDTVIFKTLLHGSRIMNDSMLWYPKAMYEDRKGNIWLAEPQSALRYTPTGIKRFDFGVENRSGVFIRSFTFFENSNGILFALSYQGKAFRYDAKADKFVPVDTILPGEISYVKYIGGKLYIASQSGLYQATAEGATIQHIENILPDIRASYVTENSDGALWVCTYDQHVYRLEKKNNVFAAEVMPFNFNGSNAVFKSNENDIWCATDKGLVLIQKNLFAIADDQSQAQFVETMTEDPDGNMYFCNKESIVQLVPLDNDSGWKRRVLNFDKNEYYQSMKFNHRGLWISGSTRVMLYDDDRLQKKWDFESEGNFVHDIFIDSHDNVWASQAGNARLVMINDSLEVERFRIPASPQQEINVVREGPRGIYAAGSTTGEYLFLKANDANEFKNISLPVRFAAEGDFSVVDMAISHDHVWLASSTGLLDYNHQTIRRIDLGDTFTKLSVNSVEILDEKNILFANSHGLFRYNTDSGEYWLYDENSGLPSNTITGDGIFVDHKHRCWIGTSYGIAVARESIINDRRTTTPVCVEAWVNGVSIPYRRGITAPYDAYINVMFSAITFPENKILLQWRFLENDTAWHAMKDHEVSLTEMSAGTYTLLARAKKNTGLSWSEPVAVTIVVQKAYWQRAEFLLLVLSLVIIIAWVSYSLTSRMLNERKVMLERLVDQRTRDLQKANEELVQRNNELDRFVYSASHDLSAPLKSILGLIAVSRMENPGEQHSVYLGMMEGSVRKLENFISDVVSYSRNSRLPAKEEAFDFVTLVRDLLDDHQYAPRFSAIQFDVTDETHEPITADVMRLRIVLNNLISNAIKFHWFDGPQKPVVSVALTRQPRAYVITVTDNGKGISEKHTTRIFEMFYRASEEVPGSGLGLYILKETVLKMNGRVTVKSAVGEGTVFTIMLPAPEAEA